MARVLYWNIQQFGLNKINNPSRKRQRGSSINLAQASAERAQYIIDTLTTQVPDIFVVVETSTGAGAEGALITAGGESGSQDLLVKIRTALGANWMLVPALRLGAGGVQEGISVYYNSANLNFTGPWGNQGAALPSAAAIAGIAYGGTWAGCLPATLVPLGAPNAGVASNVLSGQWMYTVPALPAAPNRINFPGVGNRSPFLTTFWDAANARHIKLLSFHASPHYQAAIDGTDQISNIQEMTVNLGANEVGVIVGDFNVNLLNPAAATPAYANLINVGGADYTRQINPTVNTWPEKGYIATHIKRGNQAKPWYTNGYPGYEYAGSSANFAGYDSIDNILTRYGGGAAGGPATNITIVNRVTGSPYNIAPIPAGVPTGNYVYPTGMTQIVGGALAGLPSALPLPPNGPTGVGGIAPGTVGGLSSFKGWSNYGHIRSTSDHLALIIDI
ncbi:hypothetical protein CXF68_14145 [Tenacibaculum sp. Bg11-29]|uniref:hypothetical protein n=1 Tax=Tenacibaculum sp. Bg11-29 TaxID=2058306 RepID=UPI000C347DDC|nr:hypothetical protein [Tenacibaculum sp. Bg11-29]PKH51754.1 hypothetical protein CXF68_14145 [Tenacibaculum sp. Bg11-29]